MSYINLFIYTLAALGLLVVWALIGVLIDWIRAIMVQRQLAEARRRDPEYFEILDMFTRQPGWLDKDPIERLHAMEAEKHRRYLTKHRGRFEEEMGSEEFERLLEEYRRDAGLTTA